MAPGPRPDAHADAVRSKQAQVFLSSVNAAGVRYCCCACKNEIRHSSDDVIYMQSFFFCWTYASVIPLIYDFNVGNDANAASNIMYLHNAITKLWNTRAKWHGEVCYSDVTSAQTRRNKRVMMIATRSLPHSRPDDVQLFSTCALIRSEVDAIRKTGSKLYTLKTTYADVTPNLVINRLRWRQNTAIFTYW